MNVAEAPWYCLDVIEIYAVFTGRDDAVSLVAARGIVVLLYAEKGSS